MRKEEMRVQLSASNLESTTMESFYLNNFTKENSAVSLQQVHFSYGIGRSKVEILKGVSLNVVKGSIFGLLGPSGCGKTTLLKCVIASLKPDKGIGIALYSELTIRESLAYFGRLHLMKAKDVKSRTEFLLEFLNLPRGKKLNKNLSGGEQRRVSFAIALLHQPPLLILDEPTVGVDPVLRKNIWNYLLKISSNEDVTVIVALMRDGHLLAEEQPDLLIHHYNVSTLEDVFLKLCEEKSNIKIQQPPPSDDNHHTYHLNPQMSQNVCNDSEEKRLFDNVKLPSLRRITALAIKNLIKMWRNFMLMIFQFLIPVLQVVIIFWAVGSELHDLNVAVFNQDKFLGSRYLHFINNHTIHQIPVDSMEKGEDLVTNGNAWAVINIWPNFTSALIERFSSNGDISNETLQAGSIHVRHDNTDMQITYSMQKALFVAFESFSADALNEIGKTFQLPAIPVEFDEPIYGPVKSTFIEFLAPGLLVTVLFYLAVSLTAMSFIMDKREGLLDRCYVSGATSFEIMCGHILTQLGVMVIHVGTVLILSTEGFDIENRGSFVWIILLALCQGLCGMTYGFFVSAVCNDESSAMMLAVGTVFPVLLTSGFIWPIQGMPNIIQSISKFLPLTTAINAMGWILLHGRGITWEPVWKGFAVTWAWIFAFIILSVITLRFKK
uniref:Uncharacterized protein n=1 Tax=Strigamia maritima TaxID=126957 RepID=T1IGT9_STRMM